MTEATNTNTPEGQAPEEPLRKWRPWHLLALLGFAGMALFWIWAFSPFPSRGHPDTLTNAEFPVVAEGFCASVMERLEDLPRDWDIDNPQRLAEQVSAGTELLIPLVPNLRTLARDTIFKDSELDIVNLWLDDWYNYLNDRTRFETRLRTGERAEFTYTTREGTRNADIIDRFAQVNDMPSCQTPKDI